MKLTEIYIHEVTRRLPEKNREDIALELRSTIEDMLPDDYNEDDEKAALAKLGDPAILANEYRDQPMYLIDPRYFDLYVTLLKMIIPLAITISLISMFAEYFIGFGGEKTVNDVVSAIISNGIGTAFEVGLQVFFWLTIIFAILERKDIRKDGQPYTAKSKKWSPNDLKTIPLIHKKKAISSYEVFKDLMWTAIWATLYFNAEHLLVVYSKYSRGGNGSVEFTAPAFNQDVLHQYWPLILVVIGLEISLALYKLIKRQWTRGLAICNAVVALIVVIVFSLILVNPNILNQEFIVYMSDTLNTTTNQLKTGIVGGGISIMIIIAAIHIFDSFRKARI
jgi:hypothetical protein